MSNKIRTMYPESGRIVKEDGEMINVGDILEAVYDSTNHVLKTSASVNIGDVEIGAVELKDPTTDTRATIGTNGLHVDVRNTVPPVKTATFHDAVTVTGNGASVTVDGLKTLTVSCKGTNTSRTIEVHGVDFNGVDNIITGYAVTDAASKATLTSNDLSVAYGVEGMVSVYAKITALAGGSATIKGMLTL